MAGRAVTSIAPSSSRMLQTRRGAKTLVSAQARRDDTFTPQRSARCGHHRGEMIMPFTRATKLEAKLRLALAAPSGAGKTYTALQLATHLSGPIALIDTERGSASKYADLFTFDVL